MVDVWNGAFGYRNLREENEELRAQVAELESREVAELSAQSQLEELRQLNDLNDPADLPRVVVRRVGAAASNFDQTIQICLLYTSPSPRDS